MPAVRPVRYFPGVPSPVKHPERMNVVIFRENTEDVYCGHRVAGRHAGSTKLIDFLNTTCSRRTDSRSRSAATPAIGIKPISVPAPSAWCAARIQYASTTSTGWSRLVHKGNIMKFTEGAFRDWGYEIGARRVPRRRS